MRLSCGSLFRLSLDMSLVSMPPGVGRVHVYRNAISAVDEERVAGELGFLLQREGHATLAEGSTPQEKRVKHTYLELHGESTRFTEVRSWQRKETRRLPGLLWSPTLLAWLRAVVPMTFGGVMPDTARVVEHNTPGYEMHTEHPTVGCSFLYLSMLSDTVLTFDDEATGRRGQVLLPQRALMCCSGEARWGWRFGEEPRETHTFVNASGAKRTIEPDLRLSVQLWKFTPQLLDARLLQCRMEESLRHLEAKELSRAQNEEEIVDSVLCGVEAKGSSSVLQEMNFTSSAPEQAVGMGPLGGDYIAGSRKGGRSVTIDDVGRDYTKCKEQFQSVHGVLQEMKALQDAGQPINDVWLKKRLTSSQKEDGERDVDEGFDPDDVEGTWDRVDARARFYKARLKAMDYDGTGGGRNSMPDVTEDAPLDMKKTIRKIAPLVKDGEKILANLPCGQ
uniref:Fe2OG dioxygenase domain-containing protein n=1 Tax=Trypanosoma vivax (strain Y486) TaxID=1055687 RepID=G0TS62_TRYVY|nr:conserved hypothetical protein [Trypanosoma vivax Y486]